MPANRSFNAGEMSGHDFVSSVVLGKSPRAEKLFCLMKIKATPDDMVRIMIHFVI
jgi:hypothetical protein